MIIGLSGVAGAGKDLFYSLLEQSLPCVKASLADSLKRETSEWCKEHYGIDPLRCTREEKDIIRPFLVFHGVNKRHSSKGRHWIKRLELELNGIRSIRHIETHVQKTVVITDIRYDEYEEDEVSWLKNEMKGILVHVSQYKNVPRLNSEKREFVAPANSEEARNAPRLKENADYSIEWERIEAENREELLKKEHIEPFISWLNKN